MSPAVLGTCIVLMKKVYTPPNAAKFGCEVFDEASGQSSHVQQCNFFSAKGHKL